MPTQCNAEQLQFSCVERRRVVAAFDGGAVSSDAGALLLRRTDEAIGLIDRLAGCFIDERDPHLIEHTVRTLIGQRVFGIAWGMKTSTITSSCATIRCVARCWASLRRSAAATARRWPARAR